MSQTYHSIYIHAIWTTKHRLPLINMALKPTLLHKIKEISISKNYQIDSINCVEDHVHCLINLKPSQCISNIMKDLKGTSSFWINEEKLTEDYFQWQDGYSAFSVSPFALTKIRNYILSQEEHHKNIHYNQEIDNLGKN